MLPIVTNRGIRNGFRIRRLIMQGMDGQKKLRALVLVRHSVRPLGLCSRHRGAYMDIQELELLTISLMSTKW